MVICLATVCAPLHEGRRTLATAPQEFVVTRYGSDKDIRLSTRPTAGYLTGDTTAWAASLQSSSPSRKTCVCGPDFPMKPKHEAELFKAALRAGIRYAEGRGAVEFEPTDSASDKALYVYRLLVHDKIIAPMPEDQVGEKTIRHRLASWYAHLPAGHPLLV